MFYADREPNRRPLTEDLFANFKHFAQQAPLGITHITGRGPKRA
jgi:hypothetical protein